MTKLNIILFAILILCGLGAVTSQHKARKLYIELQQQQNLVKQYDIEWGQLQLEQSTWAVHSRIEQIAASQLQMRVPENARIHVIQSGVAR